MNKYKVKELKETFKKYICNNCKNNCSKKCDNNFSINIIEPKFVNIVYCIRCEKYKVKK